jgi:hypothetical protein
VHHSNFINPKIKGHYNRYCAISRKVIKEAKKLHYNTLVTILVNKRAETWSIIQQETDKIQIFDKFSLLSSKMGTEMMLRK